MTFCHEARSAIAHRAGTAARPIRPEEGLDEGTINACGLSRHTVSVRSSTCALVFCAGKACLHDDMQVTIRCCCTVDPVTSVLARAAATIRTRRSISGLGCLSYVRVVLCKNVTQRKRVQTERRGGGFLRPSNSHKSHPISLWTQTSSDAEVWETRVEVTPRLTRPRQPACKDWACDRARMCGMREESQGPAMIGLTNKLMIIHWSIATLPASQSAGSL